MYCRNCGKPDFGIPGKDSDPFWEPDLCLACHRLPIVGYRYNYLTGTLMPRQTVTTSIDDQASSALHTASKELAKLDEPLLTFLEAQKYLKVSRSTVHRLLKDGSLKGHKIGNGAHWRFTRAQLKGCLK